MIFTICNSTKVAGSIPDEVIGILTLSVSPKNLPEVTEAQ
jgi:hypothetical protein